MKNKKILFLTTQLPFPPVSGGVIKSFHYINHLSKSNDLVVACFLKNEDKKQLSDYIKLHNLSKVVAVPLDVKRSVKNLVLSYLFSSTLNSFRNRSKEFKEQISPFYTEVDVILVDHYEMYQYVPKYFSGKIILHTHNAEFALWERMAELEKSLLYKIVLKAEAKRVKKAEQKAILHSHLVYATPSDIQLYTKNSVTSNNFCTTFHLGDVKLLEKETLQFEHTENSILFVGTLRWEPNVNGLLWFLKNVWPLLINKHPNTKFYIVGKDPDERLLEFNFVKNVFFTGFVENLEEYYSKARLAVIPLLFGSGMKVKLLEAMYRGLPTVCTSVGAEGVEVEHNKDIFIEDEATAFAEKIDVLLNDKEKWKQFSLNSREISASKYTWIKLFKEMDASAASLF